MRYEQTDDAVVPNLGSTQRLAKAGTIKLFRFSQKMKNAELKLHFNL